MEALVQIPTPDPEGKVLLVEQKRAVSVASQALKTETDSVDTKNIERRIQTEDSTS